MKYKVGDKVQCIDNTDREDILTIGNIYTVEYVATDKDKISLKELPDFNWFSHRFKLVGRGVTKIKREVRQV